MSGRGHQVDSHGPQVSHRPYVPLRAGTLGYLAAGYVTSWAQQAAARI